MKDLQFILFCQKIKRGQVLFFAFTHTHINAIYTNVLLRGRPRSFYKWAGERGNLILMIGDIYDAFILAV
ncbi:hypothetical protein LCGC14_1712000, partial [marine sediment metagenome]